MLCFTFTHVIKICDCDMSKMMKIVLLCVLITQVFSNETPINLENESDLLAEERLLISGIVSRKCKSLLNAMSPVAPNLVVTITRLDNNKAYYFAPKDTEVSFLAANKFCIDHGMHLVTINSALENLLVYNEAVKQGLTGVADTTFGAWIGYRDATGGGTYKWTQPKVGTTQTFFAADNPVRGECTGFINGAPDSSDVSWISFDCTTGISFICELEEPCSLFV